VAGATADGAPAVRGSAHGWRQVDRSGSLIRHASRKSALPVSLLAVAVCLSSAFAPLVPAVGSAPLFLPDCVPAGRPAVPLSAVATGTNREYCPTLRESTDSQPENGLCLTDPGAHSGIMPEDQNDDDRRIVAPMAQMMLFASGECSKKDVFR
jgi:hypothetical protein